MGAVSLKILLQKPMPLYLLPVTLWSFVTSKVTEVGFTLY